MPERGHRNTPPGSLHDAPGARAGAIAIGIILLAAVLGAALVLQIMAPVKRASAADSGGLEFTNLFHLHLTFAPEQWEAMEPQGGFGPFGANPGAVRPGLPGNQDQGNGPAVPAFPGRPGPIAFGLSMFLAPLFQQGDTGGDGQLSSAEFAALGPTWFAAWDTNRAGTLDLEEIRGGINASMPGPDRLFAGRERGPAQFGGPGGPGNPGGPARNMLLGAEGKRNGLASGMGIEFPTARADLEIAGRQFPSVTVRYKGNGTYMASRNVLKRSMKIDFNDQAPGRNFAGASKLNLHSCVTDPSWMNEVLSHKLFRDAGVPAPRTAYGRVVLSVPGKYDRQYLGLYSVVENVDSRFAQDRFGTKKGALFKPVTRQLFEDLGDDWAAYRQSYDPKTPISLEEQARVIALCKLVSYAPEDVFAARIGEFINLEAFARFMAVTTWLSTMDSILGVGQNFYVYLHPKTKQFQFIPWDLDHSFGQFGMVGTQEQRQNLSIHKPWDNVLFLDRIFKVQSFKSRYLAAMRGFNQTLFKPDRFQAQVDQLLAILLPAVQDESDDLARQFLRVTSGVPPEPTASPGFGPPGGFGQPVQPIKPFVNARKKSVDDQLAGKSDGMRPVRGGPFGGPGGPGGPGGFGPGIFLGPMVLSALDTDRSGEVTPAECEAVLRTWFTEWNTDGQSDLGEPELRAGIDKALAPMRDGMPGFGPPPGGFGPP